MCFDNVALTGKLEGNEVIFEGYKLFRPHKNGPISNYNTGHINYEYNKWYEAKLYGDDNVGYISNNNYLHGFHVFITELAAKKYGDESCTDSVIKKVKFKEILSIGTHKRGGNAEGYCARYMMIPQDKITFSDLKYGDKFKLVDNSTVFTLVSLHSQLQIFWRDIRHPWVYIDGKNQVYASDVNLEVVKENK